MYSMEPSDIKRVLDIDWKFGVTAASSEDERVGTTYVQLKLALDVGGKLNNVYLEMSLSQFYAFLHELEKAKVSLEYLG